MARNSAARVIGHQASHLSYAYDSIIGALVMQTTTGLARHVRTSIALIALSMLALPWVASSADKAKAKSAPPDLSGIWSGTQGVIWETNLKPGEKEKPPFTPEYAARYQESLAAAAAGKPKADPPAGCLPPGTPRIMASPFPFEIIQTPNAVYMLFEYMSQIRKIHLNGTGPGSIGLPTFNGYSEGRWEGDTLIVNTVDMNPMSVLDTTHVETSDALKVEERFKLLTPDKLEVQLTLDDAKAYVKPWVTKRIYVRKPGERLMEYVCEENNRNPINPDGTTGFIGPK